MFWEERTYELYILIWNEIHLFRRLELRNDSIKRNDKARHENDESRRSQFVSLS